jgi:hypothetical protein
MKPPDFRYVKKSMIISFFFLENFLGIPYDCFFLHPQQLIFQFPNPKYSHPESYTNNLHLKKIAKIGLPCQKLLNFTEKRQIFALRWSRGLESKTSKTWQIFYLV